MGVAVSDWRLARAVALQGELGVVSGTALALIMVRRLQAGDPDGSMRRALAHLPIKDLADRIVAKYHVPGGKTEGAAFALTAMPTLQSEVLSELTIAANFAEVFLAKEGHDGIVGLNLLEKVQMLTLPSLYGAMLAGVDYVLMGAGIPRLIPGVLDRLAAGEVAELKIDVAGAGPTDDFSSKLDTSRYAGQIKLRRPRFLAIVSSATLAITLAKKSNGVVDGFVVEGDRAGGHNAPPRGPMTCDASGQPIYGPRDVADLEKIRALGLPFWLAGSYARPERLVEAQRLGAVGIQVGTAFAFCAESGIEAGLKGEVIRASAAGLARVFTDPAASPTGFPFKVVDMPGTISDPAVYAARERLCDLGYLRQLYRKPDGDIGYRCPGEPAEAYVLKGGTLEDTVGRKCLCNGLVATVGLGQSREGGDEPAMVTAGDELADIGRFARPDGAPYTAADVVRYLRGGSEVPGAPAT
jgi:nitronate monooxygenase